MEKISRRALMRVCALVLLLPLAMPACGAERALRFGLFPNLSPRVLLGIHQPLADYLSQALHRPVYLETAPDFALFVRRTREHHYDLLLTPPHLAYLANIEAGYQPLYTYSTPIQGLLVVAKSSPYHSLQDLRGARLAFVDPLAIVPMMMEANLAEAGMRAGRDYIQVNAGSHNNAAFMVLKGQADGAVIGKLPFWQMSGETRRGLRTLALTRPILSQVYLAKPALKPETIEAIRVALGRFSDTAAGRAFLARGKLGKLVPLDTRQLAPYRVYGEQAARELSRPQ